MLSAIISSRQEHQERRKEKSFSFSFVRWWYFFLILMAVILLLSAASSSRHRRADVRFKMGFELLCVFFFRLIVCNREGYNKTNDDVRCKKKVHGKFHFRYVDIAWRRARRDCKSFRSGSVEWVNIINVVFWSFRARTSPADSSFTIICLSSVFGHGSSPPGSFLLFLQMHQKCVQKAIFHSELNPSATSSDAFFMQISNHLSIKFPSFYALHIHDSQFAFNDAANWTINRENVKILSVAPQICCFFFFLHCAHHDVFDICSDRLERNAYSMNFPHLTSIDCK